MLQGPSKLTVTALINPLWRANLGGSKQGRSWDARETLEFSSLLFSSVTDLRHSLAEEDWPGGEDIK